MLALNAKRHTNQTRTTGKIYMLVVSNVLDVGVLLLKCFLRLKNVSKACLDMQRCK